MIRCVTLATPELGDRSYLLHDGQVAVAVDPQRDIGRILSAAANARVRITCVAETHIHNDYLSGGRALADLLDVPYLVAADEDVSFPRLGVTDGDEVVIGGRFRLKVVATPGHTLHHVSYLALDDGTPSVVCSGGSLLFGTTGRTDLGGEALAAPLARAQFRSARRLGELADDVWLLPTHGFGSFCAPLGGDERKVWSSIGEQRASNLAFRWRDEETFARALLEALVPYPRYYARMAELNRAGVPLADTRPPPLLDGPELGRFLADGGWAVDLRPRIAFAAAHVSGTVNIEYGQSFTSYAGAVLPWPGPLVLLAASPDIVAATQRDLSRIGMDQVVGQVLEPVERLVGASACAVAGVPGGAWAGGLNGSRLARYPVAEPAELCAARCRPGTVILDVRRLDEWQCGHFEDAVHVPLADLSSCSDDLPAGTIWVHCAAGYRAGIAASLLARAGRRVVLVDGAVVPKLRATA
jgi:hydroxyacylglutathione hydrolase